MDHSPLLDSSHGTDEEDSADHTDTDSRLSQPGTSVDDIINRIGFGRFHVWLALICGWANASDAVEVMCISLILPSIQCHLDISAAKLGWLTSSIFVGMMLGGYIWGSLGDQLGRRRVLIFALLINGAFGFMSSFATSFWFFLVCRFLSGLGVGGSVPVIWSYFVEFQPTAIRGRMLSLIAMFWMIGQLVTTGIGWLLIPDDRLGFSVYGWTMSSWRIFIALSTLTCLTGAFLVMLLPESPRFLLTHNRPDEALQVLRYVFSVNTRKKPSELQVDHLETDKIGSLQSSVRRRGVHKLKHFIAELVHQSSQLLTPRLITSTVTMLTINFALAFGYYGLNLWFPELFSRARAQGHSGPICESRLNSSTDSPKPVLNCTSPPEASVFRDAFIIALSCFPGNFVSMLCLDRVGRKAIFVCGIVLSAGSSFGIWFVSTQAEVLLMSCIFGATTTLCYNSAGAIGTEIFPTELRATAIGVCMIFARFGAIFGNLLFGALIDSHCAIPLLLVSAVLAFGGLASLLLPESKGKELQ